MPIAHQPDTHESVFPLGKPKRVAETATNVAKEATRRNGQIIVGTDGKMRTNIPPPPPYPYFVPAVISVGDEDECYVCFLDNRLWSGM